MDKLKIRCIRVEITLDQTAFGGAIKTKEIVGYSLPDSLHIRAEIKQQWSLFGNTANLTIYGMKIEDVFEIAKVNPFNWTYQNLVRIFAGYIEVEDEFDKSQLQAQARQLPLVYFGSVANAGADFNDKNRPFRISCVTAGVVSLYTLPAYYHTRTTSSRAVIQDIVASYNQANNDDYQVTFSEFFLSQQVAQLQYPSQSLTAMLTQFCNDYGYKYVIDNKNIKVTSFNTPFSSEAKTIGVAQGMIGYPTARPSVFLDVVMYFSNYYQCGDRIYLNTAYTPLCNLPGGDPSIGNTQGNNFLYLLYTKESTLETNGQLWQSKLTIQAEIPLKRDTNG